MKISYKRNLLFPSVMTIFTVNHYFNKNNAKCHIDIDDNSNNFQDDSFDIFKEPGFDEQAMELEKMEKKMKKKEKTQPVNFKNLNQKAKPQNDDCKWDGLRLTLDWNPSPMWKMEYQTCVDQSFKFKSPKISTMHFIQDPSNKYRGAAFIGRIEGAAQSQSIQAHLNISKRNKVSLIAQYPKPEMKQGFYCLEYNWELNRIVGGLRYSNNDTSFSVVTNVLPYTFVGFEAMLNPRTYELIYSYGFYTSPVPSLKIAATYIKMFPAYNIDIQYDLFSYLKFYFSHGRNYHPMAQDTPGANELTLSTSYEYEKFDNFFEVDLTDGTLSNLFSYKLNREISLQFNIGFNPFARWSVKNKKHFRNFGVGLKYEINAMEELMKEEDDLSEYEYSNL